MNQTLATKLFALPITIASLLLAYACSTENQQLTQVPPVQEVVLDPATTTSTTQPAPTTTTTTAPLLTPEQARDLARFQWGRCGEWRELALAIGWPAEEWPILSKVLYRESRCNIDSWNRTDPSSGSRGLMQINGYWCRPSKWSKAGWLQDRGILTTCEDLFKPEVNLRAGLAVWLYGEQKHGCGWRGPWATPCS